MKIYSEISLENFEAWSGAKSTLERIRKHNLCDNLEAELEELYPDGMTETELNDLLWFEGNAVYEMVGLKTGDELKAEIDEIKDEISDLEDEKLSLAADYCDGDTSVEDDIKEIDARLLELTEELAELQEEFDEV